MYVGGLRTSNLEVSGFARSQPPSDTSGRVTPTLEGFTLRLGPASAVLLKWWTVSPREQPHVTHREVGLCDC